MNTIIFTLDFSFRFQKTHLRQIEGLPLKTNFDCDNVIKGLCDALEQADVITNDRCLWSMFIEKFRTNDSYGRIEFDLEIIEEDEQ